MRPLVLQMTRLFAFLVLVVFVLPVPHWLERFRKKGHNQCPLGCEYLGAVVSLLIYYEMTPTNGEACPRDG